MSMKKTILAFALLASIVPCATALAIPSSGTWDFTVTPGDSELVSLNGSNVFSFDVWLESNVVPQDVAWNAFNFHYRVQDSGGEVAWAGSVYFNGIGNSNSWQHIDLAIPTPPPGYQYISFSVEDFNNESNPIAYVDVPSAPVPEPSTVLLFGTGLAGLAAVGRRKRN